MEERVDAATLGRMNGTGMPSPTSPNEESSNPRRARRPLGQLSVVAFICGLAGICPGVGLIGVVLGFIANFQIVRSGGRIRGRGFALWGLGLGAGWTFLWMSGFSAFSSIYFDVVSARMETDVRNLLLAAAAEDVAAMEGLVDQSCTFDETDWEQLMLEVRSASIEPWSVGISEPLEVSGVVNQVMVVEITIHAEDRSVWSGSAGFLLVPPTILASLDVEGLAPDPRLRTLRLIGPDGRSLRLTGRPASEESDDTMESVPTGENIQLDPDSEPAAEG